MRDQICCTHLAGSGLSVHGPHLGLETPQIQTQKRELLSELQFGAGELGGSAAAGLGAILLAAGSGSNAGVTLIGDLVCLGSSVCFLVYMAIGRSVRSWMGLFVYVLPVNLVRL